jgi:hypothetical protein
VYNWSDITSDSIDMPDKRSFEMLSEFLDVFGGEFGRFRSRCRIADDLRDF